MFDQCKLPLQIQLEKAKYACQTPTPIQNTLSLSKPKIIYTHSRVGRFSQLPSRPFSGLKQQNNGKGKDTTGKMGGKRKVINHEQLRKKTGSVSTS